MRLFDAAKVNLSSFRNPNLIGFIYFYELLNGNTLEEYVINEDLYLTREICPKTNEILSEKSFDNNYHYSIDLFFQDKSRRNYFDSRQRGIYYSD